MKARHHIHRFIALAASLLMLACVNSCMFELDEGVGFSLMVSPSVSGSQRTKVTEPDDPTQKENDLISLDVFIKGVTVPAFWKTYHLTVAANNLQEAVDNLLSENWREETDVNGYHFVEGDLYDVYAVANSSLTSGTVADFATLKSLKESEFSPACVWDDGTINPAELNLHKTYVATFDPSSASGQNRRAMTNHKQFVMDGAVRNWSPVGGIQVIPMTLERAASKFEVNVSFSDDFLQSLQSEGKTIVGQPGWRFVNFAYDAPLINPLHYDGGVVADAEHVLTAGALLLGNTSYGPAADNYAFQINTYSYPHIWDIADAVNEAPALVISVGYNNGTTTTYTYYRIPLVDQTTTGAIGRNMFYRVNAVIDAAGSTSLDDLTGLIIDYQVVPWNDPINSGTQPAPVEYNERLYLQVTPHTYTLRGDGTQSVDLAYTLPTGKHIKIQYFTTQADNEAIANGGAVPNRGTAYTAGSAAAWYYNKSGTYRTRFESTAIAGNVQVSITDNNASGDIDHGTITVSSNSLPNKAIKHIVCRVYLDVDDWYVKGLYRDIYIRHFPTDNIQGIPGSWSSKWDGVEYNREYSWNPTADGWSSWDGYEDDVECEQNQYISAEADHRYTETVAGTPTDHTERTTPESGGNNSQMQSYYRGVVPQGSSRQGTNGEDNAYKDPDSDYWYWGSDRTNGNSGNYDWRSGGWGGYNYYRWGTYYRAKYTKTRYFARRYYRLSSGGTASTGRWVDWDTDANQTFNANTAPYTYDGSNYEAKVAYNGWIYPIDVSTGYNYTRRNSQTGQHGVMTQNGRGTNNSSFANLNNNYMYVIQITRTSPDYVVGRPEMVDNISSDKTVSPAFMIASQLGAVTTFNNRATAASHCASYMEVAENGVRFTHWRLPTAEEIDVIIKYQGTNANSVTIDGVNIDNNNDRVLTPVLTGAAYWVLNNDTPKATGYEGGTNNAVRCIRDLGHGEVEELNRTGTITKISN